MLVHSTTNTTTRTLHPPPPFFSLSLSFSFHSFNIVFVITFTQSVLFSLSLWYSPFLTTTIRYARIIISTFYTHTHTRFSSSHLTTRLPVFSLLSLFFSSFQREREKKPRVYILILIFILKINPIMPSMDSNSSCYSSSGFINIFSLISTNTLLTDIKQQQQQQQQAIHQQQQVHYQMKTPTSITPQITQSHVCVTRYKTELCRPFTETGKCKYGDKCQFSHGTKELRLFNASSKI